MGTNYYLHRNVCEHCGRSDERLHIGKSSGGWCFSLHVDDEFKSLDDWKEAWKHGVIKDEYGDVHTPEDMLDTITNRSWGKRSEEPPFGYPSRETFNRQNHACDGPNGLSRAAIDGQHCIGHGEGTWDLITGEFS